MTIRDWRASAGHLWALVCAFAVIDLLGWVAWPTLTGSSRPTGLAAVAAAGIVMAAIVAALGSWRIERLDRSVRAHEQAHSVTLDQVAQLELSNAVLQVVARSVDVPLAFQALAQRIVRLVPCDRVGLAVLSDDGHGVSDLHRAGQSRGAPRAPASRIVFKVERTLVGHVVRSREPLIIDDTSVGAPDFLDVNVLHSSGLALGAAAAARVQGAGGRDLERRSRSLGASISSTSTCCQPVAEIFAVAHVAQQLQVAMGKYRFDGNDVGADALDRRRDQQCAPDHHRPLRPARAGLPGSQSPARSRHGRAPGAAHPGLLERCGHAANERSGKWKRRKR